MHDILSYTSALFQLRIIKLILARQNRKIEETKTQGDSVATEISLCVATWVMRSIA
jgi:hypothetical protein